MSKKDLKNTLDIVKKFYEDYLNTFYWLWTINTDTLTPELLFDSQSKKKDKEIRIFYLEER